MARSRIAGVLSKAGGMVFTALSRWEGKCRFSPIIKWGKLALLGLVVALIAACAKKGSDVVLCYMMETPPDVAITDIQVSPNPTAGAAQVEVKARAELIEPDTSGQYITGITMRVLTDTAKIEMKPVDGAFDSGRELIEGTIPVAEVEPGTTWIVLRAATSTGGHGSESPRLIISEKKDKESE